METTGVGRLLTKKLSSEKYPYFSNLSRLIEGKSTADRRILFLQLVVFGLLIYLFWKDF